MKLAVDAKELEIVGSADSSIAQQVLLVPKSTARIPWYTGIVVTLSSTCTVGGGSTRLVSRLNLIWYMPA